MQIVVVIAQLIMQNASFMHFKENSTYLSVACEECWKCIE